RGRRYGYWRFPESLRRNLTMKRRNPQRSGTGLSGWQLLLSGPAPQPDIQVDPQGLVARGILRSLQPHREGEVIGPRARAAFPGGLRGLTRRRLPRRRTGQVAVPGTHPAKQGDAGNQEHEGQGRPADVQTWQA